MPFPGEIFRDCATLVANRIESNQAIEPYVRADLAAVLAPLIEGVPTLDEGDRAAWHLLTLVEARAAELGTLDVRRVAELLKLIQSSRVFGILPDGRIGKPRERVALPLDQIHRANPGDVIRLPETDSDGVVRPRSVAGHPLTR